MKRKTRNAGRTKQEIIEKSAPVFNTHGYAGTKMQMLIEATGYQMGGIYRHFDTKMDLARAVFQYNYDTQIKSSLQLDPALPPREKLLKIIDNYKKMVMKPAIAGGCPILNTATEVDDTNVELRELAKSFVNEILSIIAGILKEGKETGAFRASVEPQREALFLLASFEGSIMIGKLLNKARPIMDMFERIELFLNDNVFRE